MDLIGRTEEFIRLAIWRLQDEAYGVTIMTQVRKVAETNPSEVLRSQ